MKPPVFKKGDVVFVREPGPGDLCYVAVIRQDAPQAHSLVPVTPFKSYVNGEHKTHVVFTTYLHGALWTFTGFVEEPHAKRKR